MYDPSNPSSPERLHGLDALRWLTLSVLAATIVLALRTPAAPGVVLAGAGRAISLGIGAAANRLLGVITSGS